MFNVHGVVYVAEDPAQADPLEKGVKTLGELLNQVKDEQEYVSGPRWWRGGWMLTSGGGGIGTL